MMANLEPTSGSLRPPADSAVTTLLDRIVAADRQARASATSTYVGQVATVLVGLFAFYPLVLAQNVIAFAVLIAGCVGGFFVLQVARDRLFSTLRRQALGFVGEAAGRTNFDWTFTYQPAERLDAVRGLSHGALESPHARHVFRLDALGRRIVIAEVGAVRDRQNFQLLDGGALVLSTSLPFRLQGAVTFDPREKSLKQGLINNALSWAKQKVLKRTDVSREFVFLEDDYVVLADHLADARTVAESAVVSTLFQLHLATGGRMREAHPTLRAMLPTGFARRLKLGAPGASEGRVMASVAEDRLTLIVPGYRLAHRLPVGGGHAEWEAWVTSFLTYLFRLFEMMRASSEPLLIVLSTEGGQAER